MTTQQIISELEHLSTLELLKVIEVATRRVMRELDSEPKIKNVPTLKERLSLAADALWQDYVNDDELKAFTTLDSEEFVHAAG